MPESILWEINSRTKAKHHIIKYYLDAWLPIMTRYNKRIVYFDGFCGPGEYKDGEKGSPIIALEAALNHRSIAVKNAEITWLFVDENIKAIEHLKKILNEMDIPKNYTIIPIAASFCDIANKILQILETQKINLAPTLILIDPFGFSGFTMEQIKLLMQNDKCEVIINFMYEHINRFIGHENKKILEIFDDLFACENWRKIIDVKEPEERNKKLVYLYHKQLQDYAEIKYVRSFELKRGNRPSYYLFFGTNNIKGLEKMKDAMWRVDPSGNYCIVDNYYGKETLFQPEPDYGQLIKLIQEEFSEKIINVNELFEWILAETAFRKVGVKQKVLRPMEENNKLKVIKSSRLRSYTYPDDTVIEII